MKRILRKLAVPIALVAILAVTSCGTSAGSGSHDGSGIKDSTNSSAATGAKGAVDVDFATMMIPHHAQAIAMATLALTQANDPAVKALAPRIKAAQGPEIARMSGWLKGWGEPVPGAASGHEMNMAGSDGATGGMMSQKEMTDLGAATGSGFDRMWLQMMVRHHQGAVAMARTELAEGTNAEAKKLAQSIIDGQSAEIAEMGPILTAIRD